MGSIAAVRPGFTARMAGLSYLLYCVIAGLAMFARRGLIVSGNAAATATNIMAHQSLYELGFACDIVSIVCYVAAVALLYELLKPVNGTVSTVAAFIGLAACTIQGFAGVFQLAPLVLLGRASYLGVFNAVQLQAQAYLFLKLYSQAYSIALIFFGFFDLLVGYLIFKSTFLPRILGVLMSVAGVVGLAFLAPAFGASHLRWLLPFGVGEILVVLWLAREGRERGAMEGAGARDGCVAARRLTGRRPLVHSSLALFFPQPVVIEVLGGGVDFDERQELNARTLDRE